MTPTAPVKSADSLKQTEMNKYAEHIKRHCREILETDDSHEMKFHVGEIEAAFDLYASQFRSQPAMQWVKELSEALNEAETHLNIPFEPQVALYWIGKAKGLIFIESQKAPPVEVGQEAVAFAEWIISNNYHFSPLLKPMKWYHISDAMKPFTEIQYHSAKDLYNLFTQQTK